MRLEGIFDVVDPWSLIVLDLDFDHVEAPRHIARAEELEPGVGPALDQALLFFVDRIEAADPGTHTARLHLDKEQQLVIPRHDIDLAAMWSAVVSGKNLTAVGTQPVGGHFFAIIADPDAAARLPISRRQTTG